MSRITFSELKSKDVINVCDGSRLGTITELEFDPCNGQICSLILCRSNGLFSLKYEHRVMLPWNRLECIGDDAIIVKLSRNDLDCLDQHKKTKREQ